MEEFRTPDTAPQTDPVWTVDLTREEYVKYTIQLFKIRGPLRLRNLQLILTLVMFAALVALTAYEWACFGTIDWTTLLAGFGLLLLSFGLWWFVPWHMRRNARKAYDETIAGGYCFQGLLRVREDCIEKENAQGVSRISLDGGTVFFESADMMAFMTVGRRAIVLPARCMTDESASRVRQAADKLPYRNRRFIARIQPRGEVPLPIEAVEPTVVWEKEVRYETEEFAALMRHTVTQNYMKQLPMYSLLSMLCAVSFGWDGENILSCVGTFLFVLGLVTLFNLVTPLRRVRFAAANTATKARTVNIRLTDRGIWMTDPNRGFAVIPWSAIEHVIDRDTFVEITRGRQTVHIPKRYIDDLSAFDALVCTYWKNKK